MRFYFAGAMKAPATLVEEGAQHALVSYVEICHKPQLVEKLAGRSIFLDCGAWSVFTGAWPTIPVGEYIAWVRQHRGLFDQVAALDVIGDPAATFDNWRRMLDAGLEVLPTWHAGDPLDLAEKYAAEAPYLAIGGLVKHPDVAAGIAPAWPLIRHRKVHLFGVGAGEVIAPHRPESVDCSSWVAGSKFASVFSLIDWPRIIRVSVLSATPQFKRRQVLGVVAEMSRLGMSWGELSRSWRARERYNIRVFLDYERRLNDVIARAERVERVAAVAP